MSFCYMRCINETVFRNLFNLATLQESVSCIKDTKTLTLKVQDQIYFISTDNNGAATVNDRRQSVVTLDHQTSVSNSQKYMGQKTLGYKVNIMFHILYIFYCKNYFCEWMQQYVKLGSWLLLFSTAVRCYSYVFWAIATNIPVLLMIGFVVQGHK